MHPIAAWRPLGPPFRLAAECTRIRQGTWAPPVEATRQFTDSSPATASSRPGQGGYPPPNQGMSGAHKALLAVLVALVVGLGVGLAVVASDSGGEKKVKTQTSTETTTQDPTTTTATTTSTTTSTTTTTTSSDDSGGTEAP